MKPMVVSLKCANCGAPLQVPVETQTLACAYCGSTLEIRREGGAVTLHILTTAIGRVQEGTDRVAAEMAIVRLSKELEQLKIQLGQMNVSTANRGTQKLAGGMGLGCTALIVLIVAASGASAFGESFGVCIVASIVILGVPSLLLWIGLFANNDREAADIMKKIAECEERIRQHRVLVD